ncbi:MAG: DMT family transporter, partial [Anaerovoracaceae bacterium]
IVGIVIALAGGTLIAGFDYSFAAENIYGDVMAILTAIFIGLYFVMGNALRRRVPSGTYILLVFSSCLFCFAVGMLITKTPFGGYPQMDWFWLIVMAIFCQIGSHAVLNWSFGYVTSLYVSAWETFEIVSATILAAIIFGEIPSLWHVIGSIIVISGLLFYNKHEQEGEIK